MSEDRREITIRIDHLPYRELNPNYKCHWAEKYRMGQVAQEEIGWLAKEQWHDKKPMMKARIAYAFHIKGKRKHDLDNLLSSCKAYQDGLIEAGVIFYDDCDHLRICSVEVVRDNHDETIVTVEEVI